MFTLVYVFNLIFFLKESVFIYCVCRGNIKGVSKHLNSLRDKKHYLEATEVLKNTVALLEGPLSGVDALRELRGELKQQKEV